MKLHLYDTPGKVPVNYRKYLGKLGLQYGSLRETFFNQPEKVIDVAIVTEDDIPISWAIMIKEDEYNRKSIMLYTKASHRKRGYAQQCYNGLKSRHKRFSVYADDKNETFFKKIGRKLSPFSYNW